MVGFYASFCKNHNFGIKFQANTNTQVNTVSGNSAPTNLHHLYLFGITEHRPIPAAPGGLNLHLMITGLHVHLGLRTETTTIQTQLIDRLTSSTQRTSPQASYFFTLVFLLYIDIKSINNIE